MEGGAYRGVRQPLPIAYTLRGRLSTTTQPRWHLGRVCAAPQHVQLAVAAGASPHVALAGYSAGGTHLSQRHAGSYL